MWGNCLCSQLFSGQNTIIRFSFCFNSSKIGTIPVDSSQEDKNILQITDIEHYICLHSLPWVYILHFKSQQLSFKVDILYILISKFLF